MKVSAWTLTPETSKSYWNIFYPFNTYTVVTPSAVKATTLAAYTVGLGDLGAGESTDNATHTIDNQINDDFLLLEFSEAVTLGSINLNAYALDGTGRDSDALIAWGMKAGPINPTGLDSNGLNALFAGSQESLGNGTSGIRTLNLSGKQGNLWMIGASQLNADGITDGFKLAGLTVTTAVAAVPEPATWAMMFVGFAMVGAAARYRRRSTTAIIA
ncbi:hypothetical protein GCM10022268_24310 [Sphingomonas cynarae]|uniref:Ice-binding protein C-terminal domain-containing protein n=2 Tax=Sphingomonas cynarae TaxID=930197 RepID=A0ABP7E8U5_9SPHN